MEEKQDEEEEYKKTEVKKHQEKEEDEKVKERSREKLPELSTAHLPCLDMHYVGDQHNPTKGQRPAFPEKQWRSPYRFGVWTPV